MSKGLALLSPVKELNRVGSISRDINYCSWGGVEAGGFTTTYKKHRPAGAVFFPSLVYHQLTSGGSVRVGLDKPDKVGLTPFPELIWWGELSSIN
jgi:hypothetical protein